MTRIPISGLMAALLLACGGTGSTGGSGGGSAANGGGLAANGGGMAGSGGGMAGATVPSPGTGNNVDQEWANVEPNDTPAQATPLGVAAGSINVWVSSNTAGGTDTADYFVFQSASTGGTLSFDMCFNAPLTAMTATLWQVTGGVQQEPAIATWNSTAMCVTNMGMATALQPSTVYLMGVTATGPSGTYNA